MACRLPGAANIPELWELLTAGRDAVGTIPVARFDIDEWFDPSPGAPGRISTKFGGFLDDIDRFDAGFFGLSAHEAMRLDPQHRLMMQTTWEAVEDAGIPAARLAGSRTGVYTASLATDYWDTVRRSGLYDMHAAIGTGSWGLPSGRISHMFDLRGRSMGLEATCSTSLLAVDLAARDLWTGATELALVSGANLILSPDLYLGLSEAEILTPTGRWRFGDARSDGYIRSEGAVSLVLKPMSAALRDGDRVYATIAGTGVTNNGRTSESLIAPGIVGQEQTLREAYRDAAIAPSDVDYIEAHGAGTPRGDEVELTALRAVLGTGRPADRPCLVGSIKSNIGHIEAAAGLAGIAKVALAIHHREVPPTIAVSRPHMLLADDESPLALATSRRPWPSTNRPAVAGVSSFGLSATNVHIVLTEATTRQAPGTPGTSTPAGRIASSPDPFVLPLSARDPGALSTLASRYADLLDAAPDRLDDIVFTAGVRRSHHDRRLAVVGSDATGIAGDLRTFAAGRSTERLVASTHRAIRPPRLVFVFSGQGSQWIGMGQQLLDVSDVFRARLTECDQAIRAEAGWSLADRLSRREPLVGEEVVQPALWAIQMALAALWQSWGLIPDLLIGHSMGEVAAACVAGSLTIRDGAAVICRRSALVAGLRVPGAMVAVQLGEEEARHAIAGFDDQVSVGVINSANATVLAGDPEALEQVVAPLRARGVFCRPVRVRYASHAPQVESLRGDLMAALADLEQRPGNIPLFSTTLGRMLDEPLDAAYWMANLREPVRFASAVRAALADAEPTLFIELSPHPLLVAAIEDTIEDTGARAAAIGSMVRDEPEPRTLARGLAAAYAHGAEPDWAAVWPGGTFVDVPGYPWQTKRHWADPRADDAPAASVRLDDPTAAPEEPAGLREGDLAIVDAQLSGNSASAYFDEVFTALRDLADEGRMTVLEDVHVTGPADRSAGTALRTVIRPESGGWHFTVYREGSRVGDLATWIRVASGSARHEGTRPTISIGSLDVLRRWCHEQVDDEAADGFAALWRRDGESVGIVAPGPGDMRPAAALGWAERAVRAAVPANMPDGHALLTLTHIAEVRLHGDLATAEWVHARLHDLDGSGTSAAGDIRVADGSDRVLCELRGVRLTGSQVPGRNPRRPMHPVNPVDPVRTVRPAAVGAGAGARLVSVIATQLHAAPEDLDHHTPLPLLGMDSLIATKVRAALAREFGLEIGVRQLLGTRTVAELVRDLAE